MAIDDGLWWIYLVNMVIFHSYVSLTEGISKLPFHSGNMVIFHGYNHYNFWRHLDLGVFVLVECTHQVAILKKDHYYKRADLGVA